MARKGTWYSVPTKYFIGSINLLFANNYLTEYQITMEFYHIFFLNPDIIFSSHTMFINSSTKEFTPVNYAIPSHEIAFEGITILQNSTSHIMKLPYC